MIYARGIDISQFPDGTPHLKENPSITMNGFVRGGADWSVVESMIEENF